MSYILDALRKSDNQRQSPKELSHDPHWRQPQKTNYWKLLSVGLIAGSMIGAYSIYQLTSSKKAALKDAAIPNDTQSQRNNSPVKKQFSGTANPSEVDQNPRISTLAVIDERKKKEPAAIHEIVKAELPENGTPTAVDEAADTLITAGTTIPQSPALLNYPSWDQIQLEHHFEVEPVSIRVSVYSELVEDRFIISNFGRSAQADQLNNGMRIIEIREQDVVLEYRSIQFVVKS